VRRSEETNAELPVDTHDALRESGSASAPRSNTDANSARTPGVSTVVCRGSVTTATSGSSSPPEWKWEKIAVLATKAGWPGRSKVNESLELERPAATAPTMARATQTATTARR
jgi:hypothetical protein